MELNKAILERLEKLEEKYGAMGQDMLSYLDGLLHADYLTYWDYIHLDTLLSLQNPRTSLPDEQIFIIYHQITELYFKLIRLAIEQLQREGPNDPEMFGRQVERINRYTENLISSFDIMVQGMDKEEFLKFRMSLLPSSGFQSAQFRFIEILSTDLHLLAHPSKRDQFGPEDGVDDIYPHLYWKSGATELATGQKTLTLRQFEQKYGAPLIQLAKSVRHTNLRQLYHRLPEQERQAAGLPELLREYDRLFNLEWRLSHLRSAGRYLEAKPKVIEATGGTNWQEYLPPRKQQISFFPGLRGDPAGSPDPH